MVRAKENVGSRWAIGIVILVVLTAVLAMFGAQSARAETGQKALVLTSSVSGGATSAEATNAEGNGFTVTLVDDTTWGAMTAAQFADYQLIIVGDPTCSSLRPVVSQNATALADAVMARSGGNTKAGNRVLIGTDPRFHFGQGGDRLIETAIDFAGIQDGATNLYLNFTCSDPDYDGNGTRDGQDKLLTQLTIDPAGTWTQNVGPPCGGAVSLISNAVQFNTLTTANLQGWGCSVHETFPTFPTDWTALAIATDTPTAPTCGTDVDTSLPRCGEAYVLIAGSGIVVVAPNVSLTPATATNPVGTSHTVTAKVTNPNASPRSGVVVSFVVTGANAGASGTCAPATCATNAAGEVTYTYTGTAAGDDTINAAITVDGSRQTATAAKTWVAGPPRSTCDGREATPVTTGTFNGRPAIFGTPGPDVIVGTAAGEVIFGYEGNDVICAGDGNDDVRAGDGDDTVFGQGGADKVTGGAGADRISGGDGDDGVLSGGAGNDTIDGDDGKDHIHGDGGNDTLRGGAGNDDISGYGGNDTIDGGADTDRCAGDAGTDTEANCETDPAHTHV